MQSALQKEHDSLSRNTGNYSSIPNSSGDTRKDHAVHSDTLPTRLPSTPTDTDCPLTAEDEGPTLSLLLLSPSSLQYIES